MMEAKVNGTDHLKEIPTIKRTTEFYKPSENVNQSDHASSKMPGFYMPSDDSDDEAADEKEEGDTLEEPTESSHHSFVNYNKNEKEEDSINLVQKPLQDVDANENSADNESHDSNSDNVEDDDEGWITPANYSKKKEQMAMVNEKELIENVEVACMTSDFAMQVRLCDEKVERACG